MKTLIIRVLKQLKNDHRTLALIFFAPIVVLALIYFLLGDSGYTSRIGVVNIPEQFSDVLAENADVLVMDSLFAEYSELHYDSFDEEFYNIGIMQIVDSLLKEDAVDAMLFYLDDVLNIRTIDLSMKANTAMQAVQSTMSEMMPMGLEVSSVYGSADDNLFDSLAYIFLAVIAFFFTFIISGMSLVRERFKYTLERMLMTPIRRWQIVGGYTCAYAILAIAQVTIIFLFSIYLLDIKVEGSLFLCIVVLMLEGICAVQCGSLISTFANSEFQVMQFIPLIIIPQVFFTGIIPLDTIPYSLGNLCYIMPMYYCAAPLQQIMQRGAGFMDVYHWILILCLFISVLFILNSLSLKKYRKL